MLPATPHFQLRDAKVSTPGATVAHHSETDLLQKCHSSQVMSCGLGSPALYWTHLTSEVDSPRVCHSKGMRGSRRPPWFLVAAALTYGQLEVVMWPIWPWRCLGSVKWMQTIWTCGIQNFLSSESACLLICWVRLTYFFYLLCNISGVFHPPPFSLPFSDHTSKVWLLLRFLWTKGKGFVLSCCLINTLINTGPHTITTTFKLQTSHEQHELLINVSGRIILRFTRYVFGCWVIFVSLNCPRALMKTELQGDLIFLFICGKQTWTQAAGKERHGRVGISVSNTRPPWVSHTGGLRRPPRLF